MDINYSYLILISVFFFLGYHDVKSLRNKDFIFSSPKKIAIVLYILFFGLRGFIGTDFSWYYPWFTDLNPNLLGAFDDRIDLEPGYITYAYLFKFYIWDNYHAFIFFSTCLNTIFFHYVFKDSLKNYYIWGFVAFVAFCANSEINNLRNIRAILLFFVSLKYIEERNLKSYSLVMLSAFFFHYTSIFYYPLYFVLNRNMKKLILPVTLIGFIFVVLQLNVLVPVIEKIGNILGGDYLIKAIKFLETDEVKGFTFGALVRLIIGIILWLQYDKFNTPRLRIICNLVLFYLFCFAFFNELPVFRLRFAMMFAPALCVVLPLVSDTVRIKYRKIYVTFFFLISLLQAFANFQGELFHYDNLIWGIQDYNSRMNSIILMK